MRLQTAQILVLIWLGLAVAPVALRSAEPSPEEVAFFEREVRPVLANACFKCHGRQKQQAGLALDSRAAMLKGGDDGPAMVPGKPDESRLILAIRQTGDLKMPPKGRLRDDQIAALTRWVQIGAPWPSEAPANATRGGEITAAERQFWSFQPLGTAEPPAAADPAWDESDIDRFLYAKLTQQGLAPVGLADKRTLLRRVTFDLIGLPPTPAEIGDFLADESPEAYARVVERLLASPHYGERWGRHWLDVVRYADTAGDGADYPVREAYKYRNYVIRSFNADKPFDEFLREQIAGDIIARREIASGKQTPEQYAERVVATGYLAVTKRFGYNLNNDFVHLDLADTIDTVGRSILGLSLGCARCHDHKYDPVSAADYYALYGIFASSQFAFPGGEELKQPRNFVPLIPPAAAAEREQTRKAELVQLDAELARITRERGALDTAPAGSAAQQAERRTKVEQFDALLAATKKQRDEAAARPLYDVAYGVAEGTPVNVRIQKRGEPDRPGDEVPRRNLEILGGEPLPAEAGSGRLQLAEWLTRPTNPLTARVIVNRLWQHHFGAGLVRTPSDFGTRGERPTHPELLDHLAAKFMAGGWSIKSLHRSLLHSRAYRLASADDPHNLQADPQNKWLWRHARRPLDGESIRDAMLAVSGNLDRAMAEGHPFPPVQSWGFTIHYPFSAQYDSNHRSVYLMVQRARKHPYLALFDGADPNISTAERYPTTTPTQALYLMNAPFVHEQAQAFARRLLAGSAADPERIRLAFEMTAGRAPADEEVAQSLDFVERYRQQLASLSAAPGQQTPSQPVTTQQTEQAWAALARVLLTSNEFLFIE